MGRTPCCDKKSLKKGPWTAEEDEILSNFIKKNGGHGSWRSLPKLTGLLRCGKSCRLRWTNYLRPDIKRGPFTPEEEKLVIQLHGILGNRWAAIASQLAGRTDNEIKNFWNTHLKKRLKSLGLDPKTHQPMGSSSGTYPTTHNNAASSISTRHMAQWEGARLEAEARLSSLNTTKNHHCDHFLRMWNSEIGEAFRSFRKPDHHDNKNIINSSFCSKSPLSAGSSSNKCDSVSAVTTATANAAADPFGSSNNIVKQELCADPFGSSNNTVKQELCAEDVIHHAHRSDSSSSNDFGDSSDTALQLLLDFPFNNDMSFLEGNSFVCSL